MDLYTSTLDTRRITTSLLSLSMLRMCTCGLALWGLDAAFYVLYTENLARAFFFVFLSDCKDCRRRSFMILPND